MDKMNNIVHNLTCCNFAVVTVIRVIQHIFTLQNILFKFRLLL